MSLYTLSTNLFFLAIGILGISFLIGFHELGHFLFAKLFHINTPSFSIGFGPRLFSKKIGSTEFKLSAIPLGGYVEIAGLAEPGQGDQKHAIGHGYGSFRSKPYYQKLLVMFGGILFNLLFAYFALILVFLTGTPKSPLLAPYNVRPIIKAIAPESPAEQAGLQAGDAIVAINGQPLEDSGVRLLEVLKPLANTPATLVINRDNQELEVSLMTQSQEFLGEKFGSLGATYEIQELPGKSIFDSFSYGITLTNKFIVDTFNGFKYLYTTRDTRNMGGPIAIIAMTAKGAGQGFKVLLIFLAIISINLAILNLIPLPILDGGQILFITIEAIIGRDLPIKVREYIAIASWIFILILIAYLSAWDIYNIAGSYIKKILSIFNK